MTASKIRRGPSRRARLLMLGVAPLLGIVVLEGALQLVAATRRLPRLLTMPGIRTVYDDCATLPELLAAEGYDWEPGSAVGDFVLNSKRMRTPEYSERKEPGTYRVVVLGDSHSYRSGGVPTKLLWDRRLEAALREQVDRPLEFINLSVPAIGPCFEWRMWQLEGSRLQADLVILAFSVSNDLMELRGGLADRTRLDELAREWLTVRLVRNAAILWSTDREDEVLSEAGVAGGTLIPGAEQRYDRESPAFDVATHERIVYQRTAISDLKRSKLFNDSLATLRPILAQLRDSVRSGGGRLAVLLIPAEHQVDADLLARIAVQRERDLDDFDTDRPQRALHKMLDGLGLERVDPLEAVRAASAEQTMYRVRETHMSDLGHAILAEQMRDFLLERDWLAEG